MHYTIKDKHDQDASYNNFYPITFEQGKARKTLSFKKNGNEHHVEDYHENNESLATIQGKVDFFELGKTI